MWEGTIATSNNLITVLVSKDLPGSGRVKSGADEGDCLKTGDHRCCESRVRHSGVCDGELCDSKSCIHEVRAKGIVAKVTATTTCAGT